MEDAVSRGSDLPPLDIAVPVADPSGEPPPVAPPINSNRRMTASSCSASSTNASYATPCACGGIASVAPI